MYTWKKEEENKRAAKRDEIIYIFGLVLMAPSRLQPVACMVTDFFLGMIGMLMCVPQERCKDNCIIVKTNVSVRLYTCMYG